MKRRLPALTVVLILLAGLVCFGACLAEQRFPPPDFESGYKLPGTLTPGPRALALQYLDVAVLLVALGLASYFVLKQRSRAAVTGLSLFSLGYFGFYRRGCICAIGSVQNLAFGLFDSNYAMPLTALIFFAAPLVVALFGGRSFCAAVCPQGALQDLVLIKPVKVPMWLEHALGVVPYLFLGAGVAFAATGSAFVICRYDPFVPIFRLSGSVWLLTAGGVFLLIGMFVGRPYCRFLCPYGALLKMAAKVSKWRVTITPDTCTQCRLCESSCPFGAIQEPIQTPVTPEGLRTDRKRLAWILLLVPVLIGGGGWLGSKLSVPAARVHPAVALGERFLSEKANPVQHGVQTAPALALSRAEADPKGLLTRAVEVRRRFVRAGWLFGEWAGLVLSVKLIALCLRHRRTDYEPDRGACLACARCYSYCPNERVRCGLAPNLLNPNSTMVAPAPAAKESAGVAS